jgi:hypothetical protein
MPVLSFILANTPAPDFDPNTVTPGPLGFIVVFVIALATIGLGLDLVRRIRRTTYKAQIAAQLDAEVAARDAGLNEGTDQK